MANKISKLLLGLIILAHLIIASLFFQQCGKVNTETPDCVETRDSLNVLGIPDKKMKKHKSPGKKIKVLDAEIVWNPKGTKTQIEYVKRFAKIAVAEHKRYGIPASISIAQGLLESKAGESSLAKKNNNHFGIKCFSHNCKKGHCSNHSDDTHKDFFRIYPTAWESWRSHSLLIVAKFPFKGNSSQWANHLQNKGYATSKTYAEELIELIELIDLEKFNHI